jgi:DNA-binding transcriptional MocR family regulator
MNRSIGTEQLSRLVGDFDRHPAYRGLTRKLQELIGDARIPLGARLPSERTVALALGVSRTTATRVYEELVASGYARARQGSGTFAAVPEERRRAHDRTLNPLGAARFPRDAINLSCASSAAASGVAAAYAECLEALPAYLATEGYLPSGLPALQRTVAERFNARGLPTTPEQIVITSGAQSAIAIVAHALSNPGDRVMVESPVYPNAQSALRMGGGRLVVAPLADPLGDRGWDLDAIEATLRQTAPRLAYLIPDFQNPTGFLMSDAERERYAAALRATRTVAVVDETLQPTSLSPCTMPAPFASHAADTITIGGASKMFWGGLRVGWIRASEPLVERIVQARLAMDLGSSLFDQLVVTELLRKTEVLAQRCDQLRAQRDSLARLLREYLPTWRFRLPEGGLALWVQLPDGSSTRLAASVEREGVVLAPGPLFAVEGGLDAWLRIPYTKPEAELLTAVERMARAWGEGVTETRSANLGAKVLVA